MTFDMKSVAGKNFLSFLKIPSININKLDQQIKYVNYHAFVWTNGLEVNQEIPEDK